MTRIRAIVRRETCRCMDISPEEEVSLVWRVIDSAAAYHFPSRSRRAREVGASTKIYRADPGTVPAHGADLFYTKIRFTSAVRRIFQNKLLETPSRLLDAQSNASFIFSRFSLTVPDYG